MCAFKHNKDVDRLFSLAFAFPYRQEEFANKRKKQYCLKWENLVVLLVNLAKYQKITFFCSLSYTRRVIIARAKKTDKQWIKVESTPFFTVETAYTCRWLVSLIIWHELNLAMHDDDDGVIHKYFFLSCWIVEAIKQNFMVWRKKSSCA